MIQIMNRVKRNSNLPKKGPFISSYFITYKNKYLFFLKNQLNTISKTEQFFIHMHIKVEMKIHPLILDNLLYLRAKF